MLKSMNPSHLTDACDHAESEWCEACEHGCQGCGALDEIGDAGLCGVCEFDRKISAADALHDSMREGD